MQLNYQQNVCLYILYTYLYTEEIRGEPKPTLPLAIHMDSTMWEEREGFSEDSMETPAKPWAVQESTATFLFSLCQGKCGLWVIFLGREDTSQLFFLISFWPTSKLQSIKPLLLCHTQDCAEGLAFSSPSQESYFSRQQGPKQQFLLDVLFQSTSLGMNFVLIELSVRISQSAVKSFWLLLAVSGSTWCE